MSTRDLIYDCNLEKWASSLGFPDVDDPLFKENWRKLACPSMRSEWRHLTSTIVSQQKAATIKKQLLLYKLTTSNNSNNGKLKKMNSVKDLVTYEELKPLRNKLASLDCKINIILDDMKELESKLEARSKINKECLEGKRHNQNKIKTLQLKNKEIENDIFSVRTMQKLALELSDKKISGEISKEETPWSKEVKATVKSLTPGHELEEMIKRMKSALCNKINCSSTKCQSRLEILFELDKEHVKRYSDLEILKKIHAAKEEKLNSILKKIYDKMLNNENERYCFSAKKFLVEKLTDTVRETGKLAALEQSMCTLKNTNEEVELKYKTEKENIGEVESIIEKKFQKLRFYCSIDIDLFSKKVLDLERLMKKEVSEFKIIESISTVIPTSKQAYPEQLKLFLEYYLVRNNTTIVDNVPQSLTDYAVFQMLLQKIEEHQALCRVLSQNEKHTFDVDVFNKIEKSVEENEKRILKRISEIECQLSASKCLNNKNALALKFWMQQPFADHLPGHPEYNDIKNRFKKAIQQKYHNDRNN
ncbi:uncharacterized protein LOC106669812 [Cimex lectularius]|uniref:Uncharacterized protein n=1 Tax=Cimex lectularius TaxID=79782 RepID=A0A8I6S886_CIMLE|nr:uncharacterized protein LOC106669812 [Cimex lectularius]